MISFATQHRLAGSDAIVLVRGTRAGGQAFYAYVRVPGEKLKSLDAAIKKGRPLKMASFGEILYTDFGEPDDEVRQAVHDEFGALSAA